MRSLLLFGLLAQVHGQVYNAVTATRERKSLLGPFDVADQATCELACNCARGDSAAADCTQFTGVVEPMDCQVYYYTAGWCSFLGDYTVNTCMLPIVEHQLEQDSCPPNGVWSDWVVTGTCATNCGACSTATRTRTCASRCGNCPCVGEIEDVGPCGITMCVFPTPTCCAPYKKVINYGTSEFFCGSDNAPYVPCPGATTPAG